MADHVAREQRRAQQKAELAKNKKMAIGGKGGASNHLLLAKPKEVAQAIKQGKPCLLFIRNDMLLALSDLEELPQPIARLMMEFQELFQEDVPSGLPPVRGIEHQIDFIPGATLPKPGCL